MKTVEFDFQLPPELIAQHPAPTRDASRLMVLDRNDRSIAHATFASVLEILRPGDLLVVNNTKVMPARVMGHKPDTGGKVELFFLEETELGIWKVLLRSRRRPRPGDQINIGDEGAHAVMLSDGTDGRADVRLVCAGSALELMNKHGQPPLPPYIKRTAETPLSGEDQERYQTIFAKHVGAVAAPTAGLHFTPELFARLAKMAVHRAEITLHVGIGTFRSVVTEQLEDHVMDAERYEITAEVAAQIAATKRAGGRIVAVGSTSVRTLEFAARETGEVRAGSGRAHLFIYPPFQFRVVDAIITNFHLPKSTLLMMMSAFAGREFMLRAYEEAIRERYRFFSYGDAMFIQ